MAVPLMCRLGHIATWRMLASNGVRRRSVDDALVTGRIVRLRQGVYSCSHIGEDTKRAAASGGSVSCVSALTAAGVWAGLDRRLHVHIPSHGSQPSVDGVVFHRERVRFPSMGEFAVAPMQAMWAAMHCLDEEHTIAALESAVHTGYLSSSQVGRLAALAPRRLTDGIRRLDFRSQSGNETIVRLRVSRAGYRVEPQAGVPGMGHGDLLIDECVSLDVDGRRWHGADRFAIDRDRDIRVEGFGRRALRIWAGQIYSSWPSTLAVIDRAVRDARREMNRRQGRVIVPFDAPLD